MWTAPSLFIKMQQILSLKLIKLLTSLKEQPKTDHSSNPFSHRQKICDGNLLRLFKHNQHIFLTLFHKLALGSKVCQKKTDLYHWERRRRLSTNIMSLYICGTFLWLGTNGLLFIGTVTWFFSFLQNEFAFGEYIHVNSFVLIVGPWNIQPSYSSGKKFTL